MIWAGAGLRAQQQEQRPTFRTRANFVRVDVIPTKDGKPIGDLRAEDFEVFEDGAPQAIDTFEYVHIGAAGPQTARAEPSSIEASRQLAANPRNRVFVIFLDVGQVSLASSNIIRQPLINMIERLVGEHDLIGIMTPAMSPTDVVLARKTEVIARGLRDSWFWGERGQTFLLDDREREYDACYPKRADEPGDVRDPVSVIARAMIERRRERITLDALNGLIAHLWNVREERKAVITVSEGWPLFRPDESLTKLRKGDPPPGTDPIAVGPDGRLTRRDPTSSAYVDRTKCDTDRMQLAFIDDDRYFRDIIADANRANVSFYTIDPRGLAVFDDGVAVVRDGLHPEADYRNLQHRTGTLRTLAEATDGLAILNSNDLNAGLRRVADDLSSYYLLGYYSTNTKLDGTFRAIKVRVKRPGVEVRARRGYRAATEEEMATARAKEAAAAPPSPVAQALGELSRIHPAVRFRVSAAPLAAASGGQKVWVAGEMLGKHDPGAGDRVVDVQVTAGAASATARVPLAAAERTFVVPVTFPRGAEGPVSVRARVSGDVLPLSDTIRVEGAAALLFRRGPSTGNRLVPAAAPQFSRTERVRLEIPLDTGAQPGTARIVDRNSQPLAVPVTVSERLDADGQRWLTADVTLASLAIGDYVVEITYSAPGAERHVLSAIRVGR